jgi:hypothetical protein
MQIPRLRFLRACPQWLKDPIATRVLARNTVSPGTNCHPECRWWAITRWARLQRYMRILMAAKRGAVANILRPNPK